MDDLSTIEIGDWVIYYDYVATAKAFDDIKVGDPEKCGCVHCQNFAKARDKVYPKQFRDLLSTVGVNYRKESEVYHFSRLSEGGHLYGGSFHFVGRVGRQPSAQETDEEPLSCEAGDFKWSVRNGRSLADSVFENRELGEIGFECKVPWVLSVSESE